MTADRDVLRRQMMMREAICSVALSHPDSCDCMVCRAASGDEAAMAEAMRALAEVEAKN